MLIFFSSFPAARRCAGRSAGVSVAFLALALISVGCGGQTAPASATGSAAPARGTGGGRGGGITVTVANVTEQPMARVIHTVGNVEASSSVEIHAQVTGQLMTVGFTEGSDVTAGQLLFTLDPRPFQAALDQAQATLDKDKAQAVNAQAQATRNADLFKRGLLDKADFDTSTSSAASLQSAVQADLAQVDNAQLQLQFTKITAPVAGRTGALQVHQGALIRANDTTPMVVINQVTPVNVSFTIPSRQLLDVKADEAHGRLRVDARVAGSSTTPSVGHVSFIDNIVDPTTDTIRLKATFPNAERTLWPGQFVEVTLQLSVDEHAMVVLTVAVQAGQQGTYVFVVKADQTVELRPVTVARTEGDLTVIGSGLRPGEVVVTDGQLALTAGAPVSIKTAAPGRGAS